MRIAWFTPFGAASAVGAASASVAAQLARLADVEIWTADDDPLWETALGVRRFPCDGAPEGFDAVFHNIDGAVPDAAARLPGIAILHGTSDAPPPPRSLGLVTHSAARARELAAERLEPVRALEPLPADAYAAALIEFVAEVQRATPALALLDRVATELATMRAARGLAVYGALAADFGRFLVL